MNWLKNWLLNKERAEIFAAAQKDILETMRDDLDQKAEELAKEKLSELLIGVDASKIVTVQGNGAVRIGGQPVDDSVLNNLKAEAQFFANSELWKIIHETPKQLAYKAMFTDDGNIDNQLLKGRAVLFALDTQVRIINTFHKLSPTK